MCVTSEVENYKNDMVVVDCRRMTQQEVERLTPENIFKLMLNQGIEIETARNTNLVWVITKEKGNSCLRLQKSGLIEGRAIVTEDIIIMKEIMGEDTLLHYDSWQ
ncbi:hypothetical protein [Candidatus Tisiphia endosymbiont of Beris chalybata]|uniref:hypothetical protein n=1 Tax=Candidatus Tisiphia endosymbiont of Beris chalybata TaxID=3066262 RepID=UPI00312C831C